LLEVLRNLMAPEGEKHNFRPETLEEFAGQEKMIRILQHAKAKAEERKEAMGHVLLYGPPGTGKTTIAQALVGKAKNYKEVGSPDMSVDYLFSVLRGVRPRFVIIDEAHGIPARNQNKLLPVLEDFEVPGQYKMEKVKPFTLIMTTTEAGKLLAPLRQRIMYTFHIDYYSVEEMIQVVTWGAGKLGMRLSPESIRFVASRSRGTPRMAHKLLRYIRDYYEIPNILEVEEVLEDNFGIHADGITDEDMLYINALKFKFGSGPVSLRTLAAAAGMDAHFIEETIEPYLLYCGGIEITSKGRKLLG
jgi:Holliday junction DNA helicase RuvB